MPKRPTIPLVFPFGGRSDSAAFSEQPSLTTREAENVRAKDPKSGRMRGAQRSGMTELVAPTSTKIREMCSFSYVENEGVDYARRSTVLDGWGVDVGKEPAHVDVDRQGNVFYLFEPNLLVKYNPTGTRLADLKLPTEKGQVCRALFVDPVLDCIFVGVSAGDDHEAAKFWAVQTTDDGVLKIAHATTPGFYVEELRVSGDKLYAACNNPITAGAFVNVYDGLTFNARPELTQQIEVSYPIHGIDINDDGDVFVASGTDETHVGDGFEEVDTAAVTSGAGGTGYVVGEVLTVAEGSLTPHSGTAHATITVATEAGGVVQTVTVTTRGSYDPRGALGLPTNPVTTTASAAGTGCTLDLTLRRGEGNLDVKLHRGVPSASPELRTRMEDWTPMDLDDAENRIWFWWRARDITAADTVGGVLEDGAEVEIMRDKSGHNRHMVRATPPGQSDPTGAYYNLTGGRPSLQFLGINGYQSAVNYTISNPAGGTQKTMLPAYRGVDAPATTGGLYCMFMLFRISGDPKDADTPTSDVGAIMHQPSSGGPGTLGHSLFVNRDDNATQDATSGFLAGYVSYYARTDATDDGAGGIRYMIGSNAQALSEGTDLCLVTVLWDGGVNAATLANDITKSLFRVNGKPQDRVTGESFLTYGGPAATEGTTIGFSPRTAAVGNNYVGELLEILVLDRRERGMSELLDDGSNLILSHHKMGTGELHDEVTGPQSANEMTQIEGYMMHAEGAGHLLDKEADTGDAADHPYGLKGGTAFGGLNDIVMGPPTSGSNSPLAAAALNLPQVAKYNAAGELVYVINQETSVNDGGIGYAVRVKDGAIITVGPQPDEIIEPPGTELVFARKFVDEGDSFTATGGWSRSSITGTLTFFSKYPRIDIDKFGTAYIVWPTSETQGYFGIIDDSGSDLIAVPSLENRTPRVVHHDPRIPEYGGDVIDCARFAYFGFSQNSASPTEEEITRRELVDVTITAQVQSRLQSLYVQGTDLRSFTPGGSTSLIAAGVFNAAGTVVCVPLLNEVLFIDGSTYQVYNGPDAAVSVLESTSAGDVPLNAKFGVFWHSRLLLAGFPDVGAKLVGSAIGDVRNWDAFPSREELGSAFLLSLNEVDEAPPDVITGLIDARDDLLIVGGTRTITRLTGDPRAGGSFHNLSTEIGMAWGQAWCKDRQNRIYFFGVNPPGLYGVGESGGIIPLTDRTLEDTEFQDIDFSTSHIRLFWNPRDDGIHIFQFPFGSGGSARKAWFWEYRTHDLVQRPPIWTDTFGLPAVQPTAACVLAGIVADERRLVLGCEDGGLRVWDADAGSDDITAIDSDVLFPPVITQSAGQTIAVRGLKLFMGANSNAAQVRYHASAVADAVGEQVQEFEVGPGENQTFRRRVRGNNVLVRLKNAKLGESWSYENGHLVLRRPRKQRARR